MDAGVVSNFRPQAFAARTAAERFCYWGKAPGLVENSRLPVARRPPQPKAAQGRLRRCRSSPMHPASPSSRHLASDPAALATPPTPFFSSLLGLESVPDLAAGQDVAGRPRDTLPPAAG